MIEVSIVEYGTIMLSSGLLLGIIAGYSIKFICKIKL